MADIIMVLAITVGVFISTTMMKLMRRADRLQDAHWALEVFDKAPYVTVSTVRTDGMPYAVPLSLVRKGDKTFYFHCADEGEKLDCIRHNPIVALSAVSKCTPVFEEDKKNFTEHYNSAIALGRVEIVADKDEKTEAMRLLCLRFLPKHMGNFDVAIARSLARTTVCRVTLIEPPSGKCKY